MKSLTLIALLIAVSAGAQTIEKKSLSLAGAKKAISAAEAYAREHNAPGGVIAVVDDGGNLMAVERIDGTFAAGGLISIGKARTAAIFKKPTSFFEELIKKGRTPMVALNDFTPLQGGVPITIDGQIVGAVGVSGAASAAQDEELAIAGAKALESPAEQPVSHFDADKVRTSFAKGSPLLETGGYRIHTSRREKPGQAEVHDDETDVIYVVDGTATLVTGGKVLDGKVTEPGQVRGRAIEGGTKQQIKTGDVVVIPNGVPHQFVEVSSPFLYFTVKPIGLN